MNSHMKDHTKDFNLLEEIQSEGNSLYHVMIEERAKKSDDASQIEDIQTLITEFGKIKR